VKTDAPRYRAGRIVAVILVLGVMVAAGLLNSGFAGMRGLRYVAYLGRFEAFHIVAHLIIFAGVAIIAGLWADTPRTRRWLWVAVLGGTLLIEGIQLATIDYPLGPDLLLGSLFDLGVNVTGAALGLAFLWLIARRRAHQES
jgi:hypothetical protein